LPVEPDGSRHQKVNDRLVLLIPFAIILFVIGLFIRQPLVFFAVPVMSLLGFSLLYLKPPHTDIEVTRILEKATVAEGEPCRISLRVKNLRSTGIGVLQVRDLIPSHLDQRLTQNGFTFELRGNETRELFYEVRPKTFGRYVLGPVIVSAEDAGGLLESTIVIGSHSALVVTPKSAGRLTRFAIRPRRTRLQPGNIPARRTGSGLDYYNTRQFLAGESPKRINWRATARLTDEQSFMVNDYVAELEADVMIVVDARNANALAAGRDPASTYSIRAALSIADRLLRDKNRAGLLAIGSSTATLAPAIGSRQFNRMAVTLAQLETGYLFSKSIARTLHNLYPRVSQVIFISPLSDDVAFSAAADLARDAAYSTMIVSPNPRWFAAKDLRRRLNLRGWTLALRLVELERKSKISQLRAARAVVIDWNVSDPLDKVLDANRQMLVREFARPGRG
jgi:uncharacterized protein (DUF58 family)